MDLKRRKFKEILEKTIIPEDLPGGEQRDRMRPLDEYVRSIIPSKLFRYRECSELQFEAFCNDLIYAVNARQFNDPYDSLVRVDKDYLRKHLGLGSSVSYVRELRENIRKGLPMPKYLQQVFGKQLLDSFEKELLSLSDEKIEMNHRQWEMNGKKALQLSFEAICKQSEDLLRRISYIACFSETVKSVTMWSHYANSHKGFVLEYDFSNEKIWEDKVDCQDGIVKTLYPIIYDRKRFDATGFVDCIMGKNFGLPVKYTDFMSFFKVSLYKSPQWGYEKEWRLFCKVCKVQSGLRCCQRR